MLPNRRQMVKHIGEICCLTKNNEKLTKKYKVNGDTKFSLLIKIHLIFKRFTSGRNSAPHIFYLGDRNDCRIVYVAVNSRHNSVLQSVNLK